MPSPNRNIAPPKDLNEQVSRALAEDIGSGDVCAQLIPKNHQSVATLITRETAILCGQPWVDAVFHTTDPNIALTWAAQEGERIQSNQTVLTLQGPSHSILTAERTALNFLQTLSGTATRVHDWVALLSGTKTQLLDTRKTIPGLRTAQKYAVLVGGGKNHRMGLFDQFLIKENHIMACGGINAAVQNARQINPNLCVEVEVENLQEFEQALQAQADVIMLDNFAVEDIQQAVNLNQGRTKLEVSGNIGPEALAMYAATGVDYISMGALTKHLVATDFSLRLVDKS